MHFPESSQKCYQKDIDILVFLWYNIRVRKREKPQAPNLDFAIKVSDQWETYSQSSQKVHKNPLDKQRKI